MANHVDTSEAHGRWQNRGDSIVKTPETAVRQRLNGSPEALLDKAFQHLARAVLDTGVRLTRSGVSHIVLTHVLTLNPTPCGAGHGAKSTRGTLQGAFFLCACQPWLLRVPE